MVKYLFLKVLLPVTFTCFIVTHYLLMQQEVDVELLLVICILLLGKFIASVGKIYRSPLVRLVKVKFDRKVLQLVSCNSLKAYRSSSHVKLKSRPYLYRL